MFIFEGFREVHLIHLRRWLNADHIRNVWQETEDDGKLKEKFLYELPRRGVHPFVIMYDARPIGYIQYYDATKVGGGWWEEEPVGTFGIDIMIGSPEFLGRGLGPQIIKEFISYVRLKEASIKSVIIDPDPTNTRAIKAFEKAGFVREAELITPGGKALLMRIKFSED